MLTVFRGQSSQSRRTRNGNSPPRVVSDRAIVVARDNNGDLVTRTNVVNDKQHKRSARRYRSRNCRNFKRYGEFFQFRDPEMCAAAASSQRGRRFAGGRATSLRESALVQQLHTVQAEVEALARRRDLMESMMLNAKVHAIQHAVQMTKQFYEIFSHGYNPAAHPMQSRQAEMFLRSLMTEDVMCTEFIGVDMFLRQYEIGALYHTSMSVALHDVSHVEHGDLAIHIKASAVARFRISRETLKRFFPSIIQDEQLTQQLIGQEYEMQYDKVFHFQNGRIFQHESRVDFCGGLMRMVGDPFLAMKLLQASIMTKHGHWKINNQIEEDRHELQNSLL